MHYNGDAQGGWQEGWWLDAEDATVILIVALGCFLMIHTAHHPLSGSRPETQNCKQCLPTTKSLCQTFSFDLRSNSFMRMYKRHFALRWDSEWPWWAAWRITLKTAMMMLTSTLWMSVMSWWLTKPSNHSCFRSESGQCVGQLWQEHVGAAGWLRTSRFSGRRWAGTFATQLGEGLHGEGRTLLHRSQLRYLSKQSDSPLSGVLHTEGRYIAGYSHAPRYLENIEITVYLC